MNPTAIFAALALTLLAAACSGDSNTTPTPTSGAPTAAATAAATRPAGATAAPPAATPVAGAYAPQPVLTQLDFGLTVALVPIPDDDGFGYLVTKDGLIRRTSMTGDGATHDVVLDLSSRLIPNQGQEEGLLGLAFAPDFATSRRIYVNYTAGPPRKDTVSRFVMPATGAGDLASEQILLQIDDPFSNHNGGGMQFGPDGMLYTSFGDGGSAGDPNGNGQNTNALLGKILRVDVSGGGAYTIPSDNPFASGGGRGEVWAYGLRNTWRFDFDDATGKLWAADVGQGTWEEIDEITRGGNYGWNIVEGPACYKPATGCDMTGLIAPRASYSHDGGNCSVTGGFVYRGAALPELRGWFVYGDFCSKIVWAVNTADTSPPVQLTTSGTALTAFAEDASGEIYMLGTDGPPLKLIRK